MRPRPAGPKACAPPAAFRESLDGSCGQSERRQHAARIAEIADDIRGRTGRDLGEAGRDQDTIGQGASWMFTDVDNLQLVAVLQVLPANAPQIGDGLDGIGCGTCDVKAHHHDGGDPPPRTWLLALTSHVVPPGRHYACGTLSKSWHRGACRTPPQPPRLSGAS